MKRIFLFILIGLSFYSLLRADDDKGVVSRHQCTDLKGKKLWEAAVTIVPVKGKNNTYLMIEEGRGDYYGFKGITSCRSEMYFLSDRDRLEPLEMKRTVSSEDGKVILEATQRFDREKREVECTVKSEAKGIRRREILRYKDEIINKLLIGSYIRKMLNAGEKERTVSLAGDEPSLYRVTLKVVGREKIAVNGREREAFKICVDPNIGLLSPIKVFLPKNYDWHSCEPPYEWLKFKGLESSINSPIVEITTLDN